MKSWYYGMMVLSLLALAASSCQKKGVGDRHNKGKAKQAIRMSIESEPQNLDPRRAHASGDMSLIRNFWEGLLRTDKTGVLKPAIAKKFTLSEDSKTYQFDLKETRWSNGDPLTAHDFVYAWKKALSPDFFSEYAFLLFAVKNGKSIKEGQLPVSMLGVHAKDDYTLVVELESPVPYFLELVALPVYFPVNRRVDIENPDWYRNSKTYVSNGPFQITKWEHNDLIVAEKNLAYWDSQTVQLDKIDLVMVDAETSYLMFEEGELDWQAAPYESIPAEAIATLKESSNVVVSPFLGTYWIRTNSNLHPLHSPEIQKALALSINREEIIESGSDWNTFSRPAVIPASIQSSPYFAQGDAEEALKVFRIALEKENITEENFPELTLTYTATARNHKLAKSLRDGWQKSLGIQVNLEPLERELYLDRVIDGDYQIICGDWIADYRDPLCFLEIFKAKNVNSDSQWESLDYQKALEISYLAEDEREALKEQRESEILTRNEMPVIPIYYHSMIHLQNDRLQDVILNESGYTDFKWAYVTR